MTIKSVAFAALLSCAAGNVLAATALNCDGPTCRLLADSELDTLRGGFFDDQSLKISFGIERLVSIGDQLVAVTKLTIPELTAVNQASASQPRVERLPNIVLQSGTGNTAPLPRELPVSGLTLIQNSLDNQMIRNATQLNVVVNGLEVARSLSLSSSMQQSLINSLR